MTKPRLGRRDEKFWLDVMQEASKDSEFIDALLKANKVPGYLGGKEFAPFVEREYEMYRRVFEYLKK